MELVLITDTATHETVLIYAPTDTNRQGRTLNPSWAAITERVPASWQGRRWSARIVHPQQREFLLRRVPLAS
jgi:hypothetical protein